VLDFEWMHDRPNKVMFNYGKLFFPVCVVIFISGCMARQWDKSWESILSIDGDRLARAAHDALIDPQTYIPTAGALVFTIGDWDSKVSDWATEHTPVFGSQNAAEDASYDLLWPLVGEAVLTAVAIPDGNNSGHWVADKAVDLGVEGGAFGVTALTTTILKNVTERQRPDGSNSQSFPSGHASIAFAASTLSNRNLDMIDMPDGLRTGLQVGNILLASGVCWSRIESNEHFPSDVLAGAALGHFLSAFIFDGIMNLPNDGTTSLEVLPYDRGVAVSFAIRY
jgi:membrane-associated phospholipid phosphatase